MCAIVLVVIVFSTQVLAQNRAYVSKTGNDINDCFTPTTSCATFPRAILQAADKGEIICLDSGFFGVINLTFSIHINCEGNIAQTGVNFNTVNIGPTDTVVLNGIDIDHRGFLGASPALAFTGSGTLYLHNSTIRGAANTGLSFTPNGSAKLFITNTKIDNNSGFGVTIQPTVGRSSVNIDGLSVTGNKGGILAAALGSAGASIQLEMRNSNLSQNADFGLFSGGVTLPIVAVIDNSVISNNANVGVKSNGSNSQVFISNSTISGNKIGWNFSTGGKLFSYGNNNVTNLTTQGGPSSKILQQ